MADDGKYRYEFTCPKSSKVVTLVQPRAACDDAWWKSEQWRSAGAVIVQQLPK